MKRFMCCVLFIAIAAFAAPAVRADVSDAAFHVVSFLIAFALVTYVTVVLGELAPKYLAIQRALQVALWSRLAPAEGDDFFLSSINFDETKHYVRKVMNSYKRYAEIYGNAGPQGGVRMEP